MEYLAVIFILFSLGFTISAILSQGATDEAFDKGYVLGREDGEKNAEE